LDAIVAEDIRIPTREAIREIGIGSLTVGKKKSGFIRLGSFNEIRVRDITIVTTYRFFAPTQDGESAAKTDARGLPDLFRKLKDRAERDLGSANYGGGSISSFTIKNFRVMFEDRKGNRSDTITAKEAVVRRDSVELGRGGKVHIDAIWGGMTIVCDKARIAFDDPKVLRLSAATVRCDGTERRYSKMDLPLHAIASSVAWNAHAAGLNADEQDEPPVPE